MQLVITSIAMLYIVQEETVTLFCGVLVGNKYCSMLVFFYGV